MQDAGDNFGRSHQGVARHSRIAMAESEVGSGHQFYGRLLRPRTHGCCGQVPRSPIDLSLADHRGQTPVGLSTSLIEGGEIDGAPDEGMSEDHVLCVRRKQQPALDRATQCRQGPSESRPPLEPTLSSSPVDQRPHTVSPSTPRRTGMPYEEKMPPGGAD